MPATKTFPAPVKLLPRLGFEAGGGVPGDPFIRLLTDAHPLRAYLACLEVDGKVVVPHLAILMEPNEYPGSGANGVRAPMNNRQLEQIWRQGFLRHGALHSRAIAGTDVRALPIGDDDATVPSHSPLAWCQKTGAYATPLCPKCLGVMATCRDETLLRRCGLPSFENSLMRFLHCPACAAEQKRPRVFYTYSLQKLDGVAEGVEVRVRSELYRDLGPRIAGTEAPADDLHPCFGCEHRSSCYPKGGHVDDRLPAEELLFPLAYYDFHWIPIDPLPLDFHETAALLGGALPADLATETAAGDSLRREVLAELDRPGSQFLFEGDSTGLLPLESFYLKLAAVADLARGVHQLIAETGFAHLALTPDRLRGQLSVGPTILPVRWGLSLRIGDLLTTAPPAELEADRISGDPRLGSLPYPCPEAFLPGGMSRPQIERLSMRLAVEDLSLETVDGERRAAIRARLTAPDLYRGGEHGDHDLVRFTLVVGPAGDQRVVFGGRKVDSVAGGFLVSGATGALSAEVCKALESADLPVSSSVEVIIAHAFAAPADIVSLGLLMLRLLLTNDHQDASNVDAALAGAIAEAVKEEADGGLHQAFAAEGISAAAIEVLHREIDREAADAAIQSELWEDALTLALRMATNLPGWSICGSQDDYDSVDPGQPVQVVVQELEQLMERARGSLIGSVGRNASVQEVCDDFLADLEEAGRPEAARATSDSIDQTIVSPPKGKPS